MIIEHVLMRDRRINQVAAGRMQHTLRLASRARRIQDEQRIFGVHLLARAIGIDLGFGLMQPHITPFDPANIVAGMANDEDFFECRYFRFFGRLIDVCLERYDLATAHTFVGGNHNI